MSTINVVTFGTGNAVECSISSGTFSFQSSVTRGAWEPYAFRSNPSTTGLGYVRIGRPSATTGGAASLSVGGVWLRVYFRCDTLPVSGDEPILGIGAADNANTYLELRVNSSGNLVAYDPYNGGSLGTPTLLGTGATVLATGSWYCIEASCDLNDGINNVWAVQLAADNGGVTGSTAAELSGSVANADGGVFFVFLGKTNNRSGQSVDFYYSSLLLSDSGFVGQGRGSLFAPDANGNYQTWTIGAGAGSHYENVDEIPHDSDTTYLLSTGSTGDAETEAFTPSLSVTSVNSAKAIAVLKRNGGTNGAIRLRSRSGSTDSDLGSNFATTSSYTLCAAIHDTDPATAAAWTTSGLDGVEVGCIERSANTSRLTFVGLAVDYVPASPPPPPPVVIPVLMNQYRQRWG